MRNVGLGIRDNQWDSIEITGSIVDYDESGILSLDGFGIICGPMQNRAEKWITAFCVRCGFQSENRRHCFRCRLLRKQSALIRKLRKEERGSQYLQRIFKNHYEREEQSAAYWERVAKTRIGRREQRRERHLIRELNRLDRIGRAESERADRYASKCANAVYCFINYRLTHKPQSFYIGENSPISKATNSIVLAIRNEYQFGVVGKGSYTLAKKYGLSQPQTMNIINGDSWAHVGGPVRFPRTNIWPTVGESSEAS